METGDNIIDMVQQAGSGEVMLENILCKFEGHFITPKDQYYIWRLMSWGKHNSGLPIAENQMLQRIIETVRHNWDREEIEYKVLGRFRSAERVVNVISEYKTQADLNRYLHDKDHAYLDAIVSHLSSGKNLCSERVVEMERILTKGKERKANEDIGVIYFNPSGFSKGSNHHSLYMAAIYLINFGLGIGVGSKNHVDTIKTSLNSVSGEDVLKFKEIHYDMENGLEEFREKFRQYRQMKSGCKPFEEYLQVIERLWQYLGKIDPNVHVVKGLEYAVPRGIEMPFPNAFLPEGHKYNRARRYISHEQEN